LHSKKKALYKPKSSTYACIHLFIYLLCACIDFALEPTSRAHQTRKLRKRGADNEVGAKNSKKKTNQPPAAKWAAVDADALEDLSLMRRV
jgi:hypothetical protein